MRFLSFCFFFLFLFKSSNSSKEISEAILRILDHVTGETTNGITGIEQHYYPAKATQFANPMNAAPMVKVSNGVLSGVTLPEAHGFYSVPFGVVPERFGYSVAAEINGDLKVSTPDHLACYQRMVNCSNGYCFENLSEDCLVLNVHVPTSVDLSDSLTPPSGELPVMLWLHGGGFTTGSGTTPLYDGRYLCEVTGAIIVSINYRLGAFGFMVFEENGKIFQNQGFKDQQLALEWVQSNIAQFGGDKNKVTIFGNSAGAQSVMFHTLSSTSVPMYLRASFESQPAVYQYQTAQQAMVTTNHVMELTNCTSVQCLRDLEPEVLVNVGLKLQLEALPKPEIYDLVEPFRVTLDGTEFDGQPMDMLSRGRWNKDKEILTGSNVDEMYFVDAYFPIPFTVSMFEKFNKFVFGEVLGQAVSNEYNHGKGDYTHTLGVMIGDLFFHCPQRMMIRYMSPETPTFMYSLDHGLEGPSCGDILGTDKLCGAAFHGSENTFLFRTEYENYTFTADDTAVADEFSYYWGNFAHSGNPSSGDVTSVGDFPQWPQYSTTSAWVNGGQGPKLVARLNAVDPNTNIRLKPPTPDLESNYNNEKCDFWDSTGFYSAAALQTTTLPTDVTTTDVTTTDVTTTVVTTTDVTSTDVTSTEITTTVPVYVTTTTPFPNEPEETTSGATGMTSHISLVFCFIASLLFI